MSSPGLLEYVYEGQTISSERERRHVDLHRFVPSGPNLLHELGGLHISEAGQRFARCAKAQEKWQNASPTPYVVVKLIVSPADLRELGQEFQVELPRTAKRDPNVRKGDIIYVGKAVKCWICLSDYLDDKIGTIKMWHGDLLDIQPGWAFCDGQNGTPDMRTRVPLCLDTNPGARSDENTIGDTGGYRWHGPTENNHSDHAGTDVAMWDHVQGRNASEDTGLGVDVQTNLNTPPPEAHYHGMHFGAGIAWKRDGYGPHGTDAHLIHTDTDNRQRYLVLGFIKRID